MKMSLFPRGVGFDANGKALCISPATYVDPRVVRTETIWLPSDHYDFSGPVMVKGKTREEIEEEVAKVMNEQGTEDSGGKDSTDSEC